MVIRRPDCLVRISATRSTASGDRRPNWVERTATGRQFGTREEDTVIRQSFNSGWQAGNALSGLARLAGGPAKKLVSLPHDAVRDLPRSANGDEGARTGYFPGGRFEYTKTFDVPEAWTAKSVFLEFEAIYRDAMVYINGDFAAQRPNGYTGFVIDLTPFLRFGQENSIRIECRAHADSRWYSGAGLYREAHLLLAGPAHVAPEGVTITTPDVADDSAVIVAATPVVNSGRHTRTLRLTTRILDAEGVAVAEDSAPITLQPGSEAVARSRMLITSPRRWGIDAPHLYSAETTLSQEEGEVLDTAVTTFGIRTLQLDARHGLRINGEAVNLRGACIHHDNGPLGASAITRAEERRVQILKNAGFNAIRSAHNPISRATLEACDRIGMLVVDEAFDMWTRSKSGFDYSSSFPEWWQRDIAAMVAKDRNHPSVIMYSIGNEIPEAASPHGAATSRRLAEAVRELDPSRFVTNAVNPAISLLDDVRAVMGEAEEGTAPDGKPASSEISGGSSRRSAIGVEVFDEMMLSFAVTDRVTEAIEETSSTVDVLGLNYADSRHVLDNELNSNRIVLGTETFPGHIDVLWSLVQQHPHIIGDFTWTGWDYLGEAGVGRIDYPDDKYVPGGLTGAYPWLSAWSADIDIIGHRRTQSYYRETVFGLRAEPYISVHRPHHYGKRTWHTPWAWTDSVSSWAWDVPAGSPIVVDVYSSAPEVELLLDGKSLGRKVTGDPKPFIARFETQWAPGELVAIAYSADGIEGARARLRSAEGPVQLRANADREALHADHSDLAYISLTLRDAQGTVVCDADRPVTMTVKGSGTLAGIASGRPRTQEPFCDDSCTTFDGRALAIIRPTGPGTIEVQAQAEGSEPSHVTLHVAPCDAN